jgi:hypothetical protein
VAGTTQHEGLVELIHAVTMGIAINWYVLVIDFSVGRSGRSTENPGKLLHQAPGVCLKMQPHMRQAADVIGEGGFDFYRLIQLVF